MGDFKLRCLECGTYSKEKYTLACSNHNCSSLLRTEYSTRQIEKKDLPGLWQYIDWLPVKNYFGLEGKPITYKSEHLAKELGLDELYISFNGYWPDKGAFFKTCTFKELEAPPTFQRIKENNIKGVVLASAGNTGRAFAYFSGKAKVPTYIVVPKQYANKLWLPEKPSEYVHLITVEGDYLDAIKFSQKIALLDHLGSEGGAKNVARRDGMGLTMIDAVLTMKKIPPHYFQGIGSGTGAISALEAAIRLVEDGRFGSNLPKLHLSQNEPFVPMVNAWNDGRGEINEEKDMPNAKENISKIKAVVLSNRKPPYSTRGGVYDSLKMSRGEMYSVTNNEIEEAEKMFEDLEGIDIYAAAGAAVASLKKAVEGKKIDKKDSILLNITGGGKARLKEEIKTYEIEPELNIKDININLEDLDYEF